MCRVLLLLYAGLPLRIFFCLSKRQTNKDKALKIFDTILNGHPVPDNGVSACEVL